MQNNPQSPKTNRWLDVQVVIATIAMTFVLALWNMFAGNNQVSVNNRNPLTTSSSPAISSAPSSPGTILLGGAAPSNSSTPLTTTRSSR